MSSSRKFDHGKNQWAKEHRDSSQPQETRHYLADIYLQHYGANPGNYQEWSDFNYRMGSKETNTRDRRLDNALLGATFYDAGWKDGYDAHRLTQTAHGLTLQQQAYGIQQRFQRAQEAYLATGEHKYYMMQKDLREVADKHLNCDMREFRLTKRI